jgi:enamine deaminase RidA (YjgF/YER057c/UK114 family)
MQSTMRKLISSGDVYGQTRARAHGEMFGGVKSACTFVEVKGLTNRAWLVEIEADCVADAD